MPAMRAAARTFRATIGSPSFWLGLLPSMALIGALYLVFTPEQPINLNAISTSAGTVIQGRFLRLDLRADVGADCESTVQRWIMRRAGTDSAGRAVWDAHPVEARYNPIVGVGEDLRWSITLPLPASVGPGRWYYASKTLDHCRWGSHLAAVLFGPMRRYSPLVPFEVVGPDADTPPAVVSAPGPVVVVPER